MKKLMILTMTVGIILSMNISPVQAQPPAGEQMIRQGDPGPPDAPPPPPPRERFRTMQMWKLTEILDLTEDQAAKFFPKLNSFQKKVDEIHEKNMELFKVLNGYIQAGDKGKIPDVIDQIEANEENILIERKKFRKDAGKVLDEIQVGKLVHFQFDFPRKFRDAMWDVKGKERRSGRGTVPGMGKDHNKQRPPSANNMGNRQGRQLRTGYYYNAYCLNRPY